MKRSLTFCAALLLAAAVSGAAQQRPTTGAVAGIIVTDDGGPVADASVRLTTSADAVPREAMSDARGTFHIAGLPPGSYRVTARRVGYRAAELPMLRVIAGQTAEVKVTLTRSPTQLSTVVVRASATSIDATTTELAQRVTAEDARLLPTGRDAASLLDLVPGARRGFVWGGAGDAANNYQLDGVAMNHPGSGGDLLAPAIDWIEALEVRGLGAGAEYGGFQGGVVNAITRTGDNHRRGTVRANYETPALSASNLRPNEEGAEQAARREAGGEASGPIVRDRLFYFVGARYAGSDVRLPDLAAIGAARFRADERTDRDVRGIAKLTFRPGALDRIDALVGHTNVETEHAELDGLDDVRATRRVAAPATFYELAWTRTGVESALEARLAGFTSEETRQGYGGAAQPALQLFARGRQPLYQNAAFDERTAPRSIGGNVTWKRRWTLPGGENQLVLGSDYSRGSWRDERLRNGGLTWRPYLTASGTFDPADPASWPEVGSEWGGESRLHSDVEEMAGFVQDYLTPVAGLTISEGVRYGRWSGWLHPADPARARFLAVRHQAFDPRVGITWDASGRNTLVAKAHWGRYHQGMYSLFFDRAEGGGVYTNERLYFQGPTLADPRQTFTPAERDALNGTNAFGASFVESILNEAGRVDHYRQPYVEQWVLSLEKTFGPAWKGELSYIARDNRDIVGLVDRNMAENYSPLTDVQVRQRLSAVPVYGPDGAALVIPELWISNADLTAELRRRAAVGAPPVPGYTFDDIGRLRFDPDVVLTTIPDAKRTMHQISLTLRTERPRWSALGAVTATRLRGNTPGLTGFGAAGTRFSAGPFVRPNEATNAEGLLPVAAELEGKLWVSGRLRYGFSGGAFITTSVGERFTPVFELSPSFRFLASDASLLADGLFDQVRGQTIFLEPRGSHRYQSRTDVDLHLEHRIPLPRAEGVLLLDLFNVLGSDAIIARNLTLNDEIAEDPSAKFAAPRLRVPPRTFRVGTRVAF